ncbi:MAG TPA: ATPase, T2SS/T4P/T4SS family [Acidimicrobiia bacterium]|nr:ATPase, T2SS/T4P/T4SS family [Acidimicrobiia bacterium]
MSVDAYHEIRRQALARIDGSGVDPERDTERLAVLLRAAVDDYQRHAHLGEGRTLVDPEATFQRLLQSVSSLGPLGELLDRDDIEEIFIEGDQVTYLEAGGLLRGLETPSSEQENRQVIERLIAGTDRRLDASSPVSQARILDGSARLTAVIPPVADRLSATIRRYALRRETLDSLVDLGSLSDSAANFLSIAMQSSASIIVSGPPGAGKTSFLSALIAAVPIDHCVRACEEVRELHVPLVHGSYYEARPPSLDGTGEISLRDLVKVTLAMRPDLIVVGEVRGSEAFELTRAVNAGCGLACTIHANSASDALDALVNAALMAGENVPERVVRKIFASSIDLVVHLDRDVDPQGGSIRRRIVEIRALVPSLHDDFSSEPLFLRERLGGPLEWTGALPPDALIRRLERVMPSSQALTHVMQGAAPTW